MEFHISRQAREKYQFDLSLFSFDGNVILANFHSARLFAQKINEKRDLVHFPEQAARAGEINAMGLLDEIMHMVIDAYRKQKNPAVLSKAIQWLENSLKPEVLDRVLLRFIQDYPPLSVHNRQITALEYLTGSTDGIPNREMIVEELLMLWITNMNPAVLPYLDLFDDSLLENETAYLKFMSDLHAFFETQPRFGPRNENLVDMLRAPAIASPHSLAGQLEFIRETWSEFLGRYLYRLLSSLDLVKEENKLPFMGPGPAVIPTYDRQHLIGESGMVEVENFSPDQAWMPNLVLIAKNSFVWLDQLSKKYNRAINRLDQIPDEELDSLAGWGFTGLWLIGLWERSRASAEIKQRCGNPEALASAYSLYDYRIADELGGEDAYRNLRDRAWQRGIRLASDMVPNHMGIDSPWVIEHPDWFLSLDYCPFPSHRFEGPDLSPDPSVVIQIEDHYYDRTDAAVVFKRTNRHTGGVRYVYHGNDGTTMPWNDTAQLNYLNPIVREQVIQTILEVARRFPIIRFDAAMTLAKKHYQRLWFPEPGTGGAIPTRAEQGMTREQFDAAMPVEFWREVVERVAREVPDTLLLAEAFWLMEGYFVRTLGMHRVYNSAFMNMLRNEDNANYRTLIKNTLEFEPEILKRYVNFMNNPDERTAVDQFGKGDKYFGVCVLLSTLPGLPMFGHGQMEGFSEKYGMEFKKAYWDEIPDSYLMERHGREISPLLHRRWMFAGVQNFLLYDFFSNSGIVDENVYVYSNGEGSERALIIFNNQYNSTSGWIKTSTAYLQKSQGEDRSLVQKSLVEGLGLHPSPGSFVIYTDAITGLQYIRPSQELADRGMFQELSGFKYHVYWGFHQVQDDSYHSYQNLCSYLQGRGVPNIQEALSELILQPIQQPFREIANPGYFQYLLDHRITNVDDVLPAHLLAEAEEKMASFINGVSRHKGYTHNRNEILDTIAPTISSVLSLPIWNQREPASARLIQEAITYLQSGLDQSTYWITLLGWAFTHELGQLAGGNQPSTQTITWLDEWKLGTMLSDNMQAMGYEESKAWRMHQTLRILISHQDWYDDDGALPTLEIIKHWLQDPEIQQFLGVHRHKEILWFNKESLETLVWWMSLISVIRARCSPGKTQVEWKETLLGIREISSAILKASKTSGYQLEILLGLLEKDH